MIRSTTLALTLILLSISKAYACTCMGIMSTEEGVRHYLESAEIVVLAEVAELTFKEAEHRGKPYQQIIARIRVLEAFKGAKAGDELMVRDFAMMCGLTLREREVFLFTFWPNDSEDLRAVSGCNNFLIDSPAELVPSRRHYDTSRAERALAILRSIS